MKQVKDLCNENKKIFLKEVEEGTDKCKQWETTVILGDKCCHYF